MSAFSDWRMRNKLVLAFWLLTFLISGIFGVFTLPQVREALLTVGTNSLVSSANSTSSSIDDYINTHLEDIVVASALPEMIAYINSPQDTTAAANALLALKALTRKTDYESVGIINTKGTIILSSTQSDIGTDVSFRDYFIDAMKGSIVATEPTVSVVTNRPAIFFSAPIRGPANEVLGVVRSRLNLNGLWGLVEKDKDAEGIGTYGMLLDQNGIRLANSLSLGRRDEMEGSMLLYTAIAPLRADIEKALVDEKRFGVATATKVQIVAMPEVANALITPGIKAFETTSDVSPERHRAAIASMTTKPWRYVLMTPLSVFTKTADNVGILLGAVILLVGLFALVVAYFMARGITEPITALTRAADRISLGELDTKIQVDRKDEIGELAEAVARMQASLQAAIERLRARRSSQ
jgi:C4-dicarboxylate-specific signal transduction histidine kinase